MKWSSFLLGIALTAILAPASAHAQTLVAQYYRCDTADEDEADFIMNTVFSPILDAHESAGDITGWGWVEHAAGGPWRRIGTLTAEDRTAAINAWAQINQEIEDEHPGATHRFNEICGSHDDYIWNLDSSSEGTDPGATPDAWISTYWVCDQSRESRADELQAQLAQVYDRHIASGDISGWSWYSHDVGGEYRRLMTVAGADLPSVMDGRDLVISELRTEHGEALAEFTSICSGHVDYLWQNGRSNQ